ncbi:MAG: hypothetical protein R8P61_33820 [Bacteroidia bacterium]|nr:hypothetical protein [Bacteroidia bacterium]
MKTFRSSILLLLFGVLTFNASQAQSCTSLFSRIADVFNGLVPTVIELRTEAAELIAGTIIPVDDLDEISEKIEKAQIDAYKAIGEVVGDKGSPGAVNLTVPFRNWEGKLYLERTFYVANSSFDNVTVEITKTGGKNGADIAVCKYDVDGNYKTSKRKSIDKGKDTEGQKRIIEFKGMKNEKYLTIHIVAKGLASNKFDYRMKVTGSFNVEKLAEEKKTLTTKPMSSEAIKNKSNLKKN